MKRWFKDIKGQHQRGNATSFLLVMFFMVVILAIMPMVVQSFALGDLAKMTAYWQGQGYSAYADPSGNVLPFTANISNIGSIPLEWRNIYANYLYLSGLTSGRIPIAGASGLLGDSSNLTFTNPSLQVGGANVTRGATLVVAASNAPAWVKAQADYVCDYNADQVEIQAAIDAITTGEIQLSVGSFNVTAPININKAGIWLKGAGRWEAIGYPPGGTIIENPSDVHFVSFFELDSSGKDFGGISALTLRGMPSYWPTYGIYFSGAADDFLISHVYIESVGIGIYIHNPVTNPMIESIFIEKCITSAIKVDAACMGLSIMESRLGSFSKTVWLTGGSSFTRIANSGFAASPNYDLYVDNATDIVIVGNQGSYPWSFINCNRTLIEGNQIKEGSGNLYNIIIDNTCDYVDVKNNQLSGAVTSAISPGSGNAHGQIRSNNGYVTENSGTATMLAGTDSIIGLHELATTPTRIIASMTSNPGVATSIYCSANTTGYTISVSNNVTNQTTFDWKAWIGEG